MAEIEKDAKVTLNEESKAEKKSSKSDSAKSEKSRKAKKDKKKKSIFARIGDWFKDLKKEFKKVVWPDKKKVINNTLVVLAVVIIGSVLVGLIDEGLLALMRFLMGLSD